MTKDTILQLKTVTGSVPNETCQVLGYYFPGDGGGGDFYWDVSAIDADNGGTIIQATGIPNGRWKRILSGPVSTKWFGAEGNGSTDDTLRFQKCLDFADHVYIEKGDYKITTQLSVNNKSIAITSSPQAYLNKTFATDSLIAFNHCPVVDFNVNVRNSLPAVLKFNDNGIWANIPQFRVEGLAGNIFSFQQCTNIHVHNCDITAVYGYSIFSFTDGFINFVENNIHDQCYVDSCLQTWGHEYLLVERNKFSNISLIPDSFIIIKGGQELPQNFSTTPYAWQFGQALSILGNNMNVTGNQFENISGLSVGADHITGANLAETKFKIHNNTFIADSDRLKGANPPGFIWIENHQSAIVAANRFSYKKRAMGDGTFRLCRFAFAQSNTEKPVFEYTDNTYIANDAANDTTASINIMTFNDDAVINIANNKHYAPLSEFLNISTNSRVRPCEYLNVQGNDVVCKEFVIGYNAEVFTGDNYFKLPKQINIANNVSVTCASNFFYLRGEYGDRDLVFNIAGNNIKAGKIYLINGSMTANITDNNAPNTEIIWDWAPTAKQASTINIIGNPALAKASLAIYLNYTCNIVRNVFSQDVKLGNLLIASTISDNIFLSSLILLGSNNYMHIIRNFFKSRVLLINAILYKTDFTDNTFEGNGLGIYGYDPSSISLQLEYTSFVRNTFVSDITFNAIEFPDYTLFSGINYMLDNTTVNRNNVAVMAICNRTGTANLHISPVKGTTAQRPTGQPVGAEYLDTTIQKKIIWWGSNWKDLVGNNA